MGLIFVTCWLAKPLIAQNPTKTVRRGFKIEYTNVLPNSCVGKAPIRVRITRVPAVPQANNESFNVSVDLKINRNYKAQTLFSTELVLPAGKTSAEVELLVTLASQKSYQYDLIVEQGSRHTDSRDNDLLTEQFVWPFNTDASNWLLLSSKAPKNKTYGRTCYSGKPPNKTSNGGFGTSPRFQRFFRGDNAIPGLKKIFSDHLDNVLNRANWHALQPTELPETWVGLSSINYILISNDEFKSLTQVPAYRKIIQQWVSAGGCLIVFNTKDSLSHASSIFPSLLGTERLQPSRHWSPADSNPNQSPPIHLSLNQASKPASELVAKDRFAFSPYLEGIVVAMVSPEVIPTGFVSMHFRQPVSIINRSSRVNAFRRETGIPGVGKPPIALFGIFTGLFLFLIGPVILVIVTLNNDRRFLFFFVPVFSFLTCTAILGYAVVVDFNKQLARTDTITVLDSRSGFAYSEAHSAYYCGSQPPYYVYDKDTLVQTTVSNDDGYRIRELPEEIRLSSPRIQPRKVHEVYTAKPYPTQQRFLVNKSAENRGVPEVTNLLGGRIERAVFEYRGKIYLVRDLDPKQKTLGIETPLQKCRRELHKAVANHQTRGGSSLLNSGGTKINAAINQRRPGNFVAVITVNPAIEPLIEPFDYKLQLHVVHGKY